MSDDDFSKLNGPETSPEPVVAEPVVETPAAEPVVETPPVVEPEDKTDTKDPVVAPLENKTGTLKIEGEVQAEVVQSGDPQDPAKAAKTDAVETPPETTQATINYEGAYKDFMAPFTANGKTIELKSPAEAKQLMQMGANYTRKMQAIAPHRKVLMMLENNGLLDEGKLSFLIDIEKKNPDAIRKLVKDSGIDPMEIDTSVEPAYQVGNHKVSDEEASFRTVLDDMKSSEAGQKTIQAINADWDQASKDVLWSSPEVLTVIQEQRENGIYARITSEIDRRKTLGQISPNVSFLQAYRDVGLQLEAVNGFADLVRAPVQTAPVAAPAPVPVAVRVAAPGSTVINNDKASAASSSRTTSKSAQPIINPLAMSDDAFMKQYAGRV
jgi:hypothetical protein